LSLITKTFPQTFSWYYEETIGSSHKETIISTFEEALEKTNETPDKEIIIATFEEALEKTLGSSYEENNLTPY
jgi:predicted ATP-grasp superfamily ATP-dependent carboligase